MAVIDLTLNLNSQAWALLQALSMYDEDSYKFDYESEYDAYDVRCQTSAWYNGRERGFQLIFRRTMRDEYVCVWFAECRNSDQIVVYLQEGKGYFTNPQEVTLEERTWKDAKYFPFLRLDQASEHIVNSVSKHFHRK